MKKADSRPSSDLNASSGGVAENLVTTDIIFGTSVDIRRKSDAFPRRMTTRQRELSFAIDRLVLSFSGFVRRDDVVYGALKMFGHAVIKGGNH